MPLDAEIRQALIKSLMETPLGPNENVMSLVTTYYDSLWEREHKLQDVQEKISNTRFKIALQKDTKSMDLQYFNENDSKYNHLKAELTDLNLQKINLENSISDLKAENTADVLEKGTDNFATLYDSKLRAEERKFKWIYGNKAVSQMKEDFKRQVTDVTILTHKKLIAKYEDTKALLAKSEASLNVCLTDLREKIPH